MYTYYDRCDAQHAGLSAALQINKYPAGKESICNDSEKDGQRKSRLQQSHTW
jgi:hypothetical protein